jgi:predicted amidohydrolase
MRGFSGVDILGCVEYTVSGLHAAKFKEVAMEIPNHITDRFAEAAQKHNLWIQANFVEKNYVDPSKNPFNTALFFDNNGKIVLKYHKMNPYVPKEPWFPGREVPVVDGPKESKLAVIICYDGMFPETAREAAFKGANVLFHPAYYPPSIQYAWEFTNCARAFENLMYVVAANGIGNDYQFSYFGHSLIVNFDGRIISKAGTQVEEALLGELYPKIVEEVRRTWGTENPFKNLKHRGYVAVPGGDATNPYTYMKDWEFPEDTYKTFPKVKTKATPLIRSK